MSCANCKHSKADHNNPMRALCMGPNCKCTTFMESTTMKRKIKRSAPVVENATAPEAKKFCSYCKKNTMEVKDANYIGLEVWECAHCRMVERYERADRGKVERSNAEDKGAESTEEVPMSKGTLENLKEARERQASEEKPKRSRAAKSSASTEKSNKDATTNITELGALFPAASVKTSTPKQPSNESAESSKKEKTMKTSVNKKQVEKMAKRATARREVAKVRKADDGKRAAATKKTVTNGTRTSLTDAQAKSELAKILKNDPEIESPSAAIEKFRERKLSYNWPKFKKLFKEVSKPTKK